MKLELEVVGPHRGQTFKFRDYHFVDGRVTVDGTVPQVMGASTYLERTQQAYPVGSKALQEMIDLLHPSKPAPAPAPATHPVATATPPVAPVPPPAPATGPAPAAAPLAAAPASEGVINGDVQVPEGAGSGRSAEVLSGGAKVPEPSQPANPAGGTKPAGAPSGPTRVLPSGGRPASAARQTPKVSVG